MNNLKRLLIVSLFLLIPAFSFAIPVSNIAIVAGGLLSKLLIAAAGLLLLPIKWIYLNLRIYMLHHRFKVLFWFLPLALFFLFLRFADKDDPTELKPYQKIHATELESLLTGDEASLVIDLRASNQYKKSHVVSAQNWHYSTDLSDNEILFNINDHCKEYDIEDHLNVIVYCVAGDRSQKLSARLAELKASFIVETDIYLLKRGYGQVLSSNNEVKCMNTINKNRAAIWATFKDVIPVEVSDVYDSTKFITLNESGQTKPYMIEGYYPVPEQLDEPLFVKSQTKHHFIAATSENKWAFVPFMYKIRYFFNSAFVLFLVITLLQGFLLYRVRRLVIWRKLRSKKTSIGLMLDLLILQGAILIYYGTQAHYEYFDQVTSNATLIPGSASFWHLIFFVICLMLLLENTDGRRLSVIKRNVRSAIERSGDPSDLVSYQFNFRKLLILSVVVLVVSLLFITTQMPLLVILNIGFFIIAKFGIDYVLQKRMMKLVTNGDSDKIAEALMDDSFTVTQKELIKTEDDLAFLKHYAISDNEVENVILDANIYQDTLGHPTPLALSLFKKRWSTGGAAVAAYAKYNALVGEDFRDGVQIRHIGNKVYRFVQIDQETFKLNKLNGALHAHLLNSYSKHPNYYETIWHYKIVPAAEKRIKALREDLNFNQVSRWKWRRIQSHLKHLYASDLCVFQEEIALMHQKAFDKANKLCDQQQTTFSVAYDGINRTRSIVSLYDADLTFGKGESVSGNIQSSLAKVMERFKRFESLKQRSRDLYLNELAAFFDLLKEMSHKIFGDTDKLFFFTSGELRKWSVDQLKGNQTLLEGRINEYQSRKAINYPSKLSWKVIEALQQDQLPAIQKSVSTTFKGRVVSQHWKGRRVAGIIRKIASIENLKALEIGDIALFEHILPDQVLHCKDVVAIISETGNILNHSAILARELNIPMVVNVNGVWNSFNDKERVEISSEGLITKRDNESSYFIKLEDIQKEQGGGKAYRLKTLKSLGHDVPASWVIHHNLYQEFLRSRESEISADNALEVGRQELPASIQQELKRFYDDLPQTQNGYIIRSSGNIEDGAVTSFAGLFRSFENVRSFDSFLKGVIYCWEAPYLLQDTTTLKLSEIQLSLIVQEYLEMDWGGVLFTTHPNKAFQDQLLIEFDGDSKLVTEGRSTNQSVRIDKNELTWKDTELRMPDELIAQLARIGVDLEKHFKNPQDIEWAVKDDQIYLLQTRDITAFIEAN